MYSTCSLPITSHSSAIAAPALSPAARSFSSSNGSGAFPFSLRLHFTGEITDKRPSAKTWTGIPSIEAKAKTRSESRTARHERVRKKVHGTPERPRMCVFRSNKHLYVQVIDDTKMHTLAAASTMQKPVIEEIDFSSGPTIEVAKKVGEAIAKSCLDKGITQVAFDRGGYPYHGRVQALADAAREHGLLF
ncbi:50S ribosomal protein L18, chloroplastic [Dendrobium catenatum]|uniref:Large ribosomal subunit protein uL18c n=1 Tax=Dendrobium catenatum TaxID=906689 RepID=A0A2I0WQV4_9ASPA|nr:50S ribosomal protein L18, chloroplastic [Dendrobium catenatum]PKU78043.1 50S ribosomal protein L18, chloroplastic [Dendrobium catenatum]